MIEFDAPWIAFRSFFEAGGNVLWGIFVATLLMWTLIVERFWFFRTVLPKRHEAAVAEWEARSNKTSWASISIRAQLVSQIAIESRRNISTIQVLMVILPLLGLLGTVTGMIKVFSVMAIAGTSNARLMAGGVSAATIPTMAGLVAALSGLYLAVYLKRRAETEIKLVRDALVEV
jgi:biopolymer transport protein ExbB